MRHPSLSSGNVAPGSQENHVALKVTAIVVAVFLIYSSSLHGAWIGDDFWYLPNNALLHDPNRLWKAWFVPGSWVEFYPIQETVQWFQWQLWQTHTLGYHLTNVLLHLLSSLLVWRLLAKFGLRFAWLGGLLFAIHPEVVDSVCEIVELKNTLSLPPLLVAMCFYLDYEETKSRRAWLWALASFLVSMLCKITAAPFPVVILLYVWWKRGRIGWSDLKATVPFFVVSLALGLMTTWAGEIYAAHTEHGPVDLHSLDNGPLYHLALVGQIASFYLARAFWPIDPMPIYPLWTVDPSRLLQFLPWFAFAVAFAWLWTKRHTWGRHALLGFGFFFICLGPFLGFNYISYMYATWTLDHMLYIPLVGLLGLIVAALGDLDTKLPASSRLGARGLLIVVLSLMTFQSSYYASQFLGEESLARYNLLFNPYQAGLHNNLGSALATRGDDADGIEQFQIALQIDPHFTRARYNLASAYDAVGDASEAIAAYRQVLAEDSTYHKIHVKLGDVYLHASRLPEAVEEYRQAILLHDDTVLLHINFGTALFLQNKTDEGIQQFRLAAAMDPGDALAEYNLAKALCLTGHPDEGIAHYRQAIKLKSDYVEAYNNLAIALFKQGHPSEAVDLLRRALAIDPGFDEAGNNLKFIEQMNTANSAALAVPPK